MSSATSSLLIATAAVTPQAAATGTLPRVGRVARGPDTVDAGLAAEVRFGPWASARVGQFSAELVQWLVEGNHARLGEHHVEGDVGAVVNLEARDGAVRRDDACDGSVLDDDSAGFEGAPVGVGDGPDQTGEDRQSR
jgi:hypothetical protein